MKMSQCCRQMMVWGLVCLVMTSGAAMAQDKALKVLPDNSLLCIKLNGIETSLSQLDNYLMGVSPFLPGMLVKGQLGALLGNPALAGLDQQGSLVIFVVPATDPAGPMPVMPGLLVPVTDYQTFISGSQTCNDMGNGMAMMTMEDVPPLQIVQAGDFALMAPAGMVDMEALKQQLRLSGGSSLGQGLSKAAVKEATSNSLWVYANLQQVNAMFGPMLQMGAMSAKQELQAMAAQQPEMGQLVSMIDSILAMLDQLGTATVSLNAQPTSLNLTGSFSAASGSALAKALDNKADHANLDRMMGQMDTSAMMSMAGSYEGEQVAQLMELVLGDIGKTFSDKLKAAGTISKVQHMNIKKDAEGKPGMAAVSLALVDNPKPMAEMMSNPNAMMESLGMNQLLENSGAGMSFETSEPETMFSHQGVEVKGVTQKMVLDNPDAPENQMAAAMGTDTVIRWAVMDKTVVSATGTGCDDEIKGMIDLAKQGVKGSASAELKTLLGHLSDSKDVDIVATYNYTKMIDLMAAVMPIPMPAMEIPVKTPLVMAGKSRQGTAYGELAVPKAHAQELMQFVQMMMMQQMQQQMQQQP